jgi:hypothetical protein
MVSQERGPRVLDLDARRGLDPDDGLIRFDAPAASPMEKDRRRHTSGGQAAGEGKAPPPSRSWGHRMRPVVGDALPQFGRCVVWP